MVSVRLEFLGKPNFPPLRSPCTISISRAATGETCQPHRRSRYMVLVQGWFIVHASRGNLLPLRPLGTHQSIIWMPLQRIGFLTQSSSPDDCAPAGRTHAVLKRELCQLELRWSWSEMACSRRAPAALDEDDENAPVLAMLTGSILGRLADVA